MYHRASPGPLVVIVGPTASGKSALAMQIAHRHNAEIISADSRAIYRGLDIGTAKPSLQDQALVRHHLVDIRDPDETFSAAEFKNLATQAIADIGSRHKLPILVGGTGLYVDSIIFDYNFGAKANLVERARLNQLSVAELQDLCRENNIDLPINNKNKRHLIRAIESGGLLKDKHVVRENTLVVGIATSREVLKDRIRRRAQEMLDAGVLGEVATAGAAYRWSGEALKGNAYRAFRNLIQGEETIAEAIEKVVQKDAALAKRQMTWFKRNPYIVWSEDTNELLTRVDTFLDQRSK